MISVTTKGRLRTMASWQFLEPFAPDKPRQVHVLRLKFLKRERCCGHRPTPILAAEATAERLRARTKGGQCQSAVISAKIISYEHMIHHFYAMAGAIPYARTALKAVGADIKAALMLVETLSAVQHENSP